MSKTNPLVTIIVPMYNVERYLVECIESIISQTYHNLEILLIDDGSTDKTKEYAEKYVKVDSRIKLLCKENGGLSSARNIGLKYANGDYIVFVDSDDYLDKAFVERLYSLACWNRADVVACSFESYSHDNSVLKKSPTWPREPLSGIDAIEDMFRNKRPSYIWLCLYRATLFKENGIVFPEGQDFEDIPTKVKLLYYARTVAFTNEKLYHYQIRNTSITGKVLSNKRYNDFVKSLVDVREFIMSRCLDKKIGYLDYFEFYSLNTLMNYLARDGKDKPNNKRWGATRKKMKGLFLITKFPSIKQRVISALVIIVSSNYYVYSRLYRGFKSRMK